MKNVRSMSIQLLRLLLLAGICAVSFLIIMHVCSHLLISKYFPGSALQIQMTEKRIESFGDYVLKNSISITDTDDLMSWCNRQPMVLMEIYRGNLLYFNSNYDYSDPLIDQNIEATLYNWYSYYELQFADGPAEVLIYSDESFILNTWITIAAIVLSGMLFIAVVLIGIRKTIRYIYLLCDEIQIMGSGNLEHTVTVRGSNELGLLAKELDHMRSALLYHHRQEQYMLRKNNDMITGLSHDLRTPMTKLLLYTEILQNRKYEDEKQMRQYLTRIHEKGVQMKEISDHLLRYSLTQGEQIMSETQEVSFKNAFFDRLSEMTDYLVARGFNVECELVFSEVMIRINELFLDRILDNFVSNIEKYADKTCPVKIRSVLDEHTIGIAVGNTLSSKCDWSDSSCIGIESIRTMMRQMNGTCKVEQTKTTFEIEVLFPRKQDMDN